MQGRQYAIPFENIAVAAAQDLFSIAPADDKPIVITGLSLDNVGGVADAGDTQEEMLRLAIIRGHATVGSGGSSATPRPIPYTSGQAAAFTARTNDTTIASAGTAVTAAAFGWNTRAGLREFWPDEQLIGAVQADGLLVIRLLSTPADSFQVSGTLWVAEGG
jgi:hypothetical protein